MVYLSKPIRGIVDSYYDRVSELKARMAKEEGKIFELLEIKRDLQRDVDELEVRRRELVIEIQQMILNKKHL